MKPPTRRQRDYKRMAATEYRWATLARKEGNDNARQAKRAITQHHPTLAKGYLQEARWDFWWWKRRVALGNKYARQAGRR